jgi:hypothetical protein
MTVDLQIYYPNSRKEMNFIPITSPSTFNTYWKPLATQLKLEQVCLFAGGLRVQKDGIDSIVQELSTFADHLITMASSEIPPHIRDSMLSTLSRITSALADATTSSEDIDVWFG